MNNQTISVIMAVYNNEETVLESVFSILNQTYENIEFLIIDDCSNDNTLNKLYSIKDDRVSIFLNQENIGLTKSLNKLITLAKGDLIARQDGDDISLKNRLYLQTEFLHSKKLDACTTRALIKNNMKPIPKISHLLPKKLIIKYKNPFIHGTLLIKKEVLEKIGFYDERFLFAQDYKLFSDLLREGFKIKTISKKLYVLNMEDNISQKYKDEQRYFAKLVKKSFKT